MPVRHSIDELRAVAYQLYPRGLYPSDAYDASEENRRLVAARRRAAAEHKRWKAMLDRIGARHPALGVQDGSLHLFSDPPRCDACYSVRLWLPKTMYSAEEQHRYIGILVSFVVPYYVVYSSRRVLLGPPGERPTAGPERPPAPPAQEPRLEDIFKDRPMPQLKPGAAYVVYVNSPSEAPKPKREPEVRDELRFELAPDEQPYLPVILEEIAETFAGYEPLPKEIGEVRVPDVVAGGGDLGESTLYDCLFTHVL